MHCHGMIAGIFSKFGKVGVIVGFILGNGILAYVTTGNSEAIIYFKEILIASLGLLLVPKNISIDIEEIIGKSKLLGSGPVARIEDNKETIYKLNNVSETIQDIADTYKEAAATIVEEEEIEETKNLKIFIEELQNNLDGLEENILYDDMQNNENEEILKDIFKELNINGQITRSDLLEIFANHNNYIVGFDNVEISMKLEEDIKRVVNTINETYKKFKLNFIYKQKIDENKRNLGNQLDGVSKVISSLANNLEKNLEDEATKFIIEREEIIALAKERNINIQDLNIKQERSGRYIVTIYIDSCQNPETKRGCSVQIMEKILYKVLGDKIVLQKSTCGLKNQTNLCVNTYASADKYILQLGVSKKTKDGSSISGDSNLTIKLDDGKYLLAISDGMGTGPKARQASQIAVKMLQRLLSSGFDKDTSIELINSTLSQTTEEDTFATLDIAILDLYAGNIEFIKNGACPTYIKENNKKVQIIKSLTLPAGILENISLVVYDKDIEDSNILVMCSDGIMESNAEYKNKELWVRDILESIETDNVQKIADIITKEAIDNGYGITKDDMTIIVARFIKR